MGPAVCAYVCGARAGGMRGALRGDGVGAGLVLREAEGLQGLVHHALPAPGAPPRL